MRLEGMGVMLTLHPWRGQAIGELFSDGIRNNETMLEAHGSEDAASNNLASRARDLFLDRTFHSLIASGRCNC